ncbi:hypothetical protein [Yeosuana sp.]|uniref:hypothetical protein n=1 Tax=Yeosuana sp. TaxID=2529388 RepID=UPI004054B17A|tara:strand:+ start:1344 stop:1496 length:153 start_codon:yes stop_codon:yes gene_type:complete
MNDSQRLEQAVINLTNIIDNLQLDIKELKKSNTSLTTKIESLSNRIDNLD